MQKLLVALFLLLFSAGCGRTGVAPATVKIGGQVWMAENLDVERYSNGDKVRHAESLVDWNDAISKEQGAWCFAGDGSVRRGRLYNWYAVTDQRGLAPKGWRVPTDEEWSRLAASFGGDSLAEKMKSPKGGFAVHFFGSRNCLGDFFGSGTHAFFWTATPSSSWEAWDREVSTPDSRLQRVSVGRGIGMSVRCIRN